MGLSETRISDRVRKYRRSRGLDEDLTGEDGYFPGIHERLSLVDEISSARGPESPRLANLPVVQEPVEPGAYAPPSSAIGHLININFQTQSPIWRSDSAIANAARSIDVEPEALHAVIDVEAAGRGFDSRGRVKMRFEPHVFSRRTGGQYDAAYPRISIHDWKTAVRSVPRDSYPLLIEAIGVDAEEALNSSSWGAGQIMGFNHKISGYPRSAADMVSSFLTGEDAQILAIVAFIKSNRLDTHLRSHDFVAFAEGYNGPSQAEHDYSGRIFRAYERRARRPAFKVLRLGASGEAVTELQNRLNNHGYQVPVDGHFGTHTERAVQHFQSANQLMQDGVVGAVTWSALRAEPAGPAAAPAPRPRPGTMTKAAESAGGLAAVMAALGFSLDEVPWWAALILIALILALTAYALRHDRKRNE